MIQLKPKSALPILAVPLLLLWAGGGFAAQYLNSGEPMCAGSDPTVVMCDDFEDGNWFQTNENPNDPANDGWWSLPNTAPANAVSGGAVGTSWTASTGHHGPGSNKAAWHLLGPANNSYNEIYHRFYVKFLSGYDFGHLKIMAYHHDTDIDGQVGFFHNPFGGNKFSMIMMEPDRWFDQNQGNDLSWTIGSWHYIEVRIRLDTPKGSGTGIVQVWADNCGANGLGCTGSGTLRLSYTGLNIRRSGSLHLGAIHHEFWLPDSPPEFTGGGTAHFDQVIVRTARIGPMGTIAPPSNLRVR
jgi:hypothetical protein